MTRRERPSESLALIGKWEWDDPQKFCSLGTQFIPVNPILIPCLIPIWAINPIFFFFFVDTIDLQLFYATEKGGPGEIKKKSEGTEPLTGPDECTRSGLPHFVTNGGRQDLISLPPTPPTLVVATELSSVVQSIPSHR